MWRVLCHYLSHSSRLSHKFAVAPPPPPAKWKKVVWKITPGPALYRNKEHVTLWVTPAALNHKPSSWCNDILLFQFGKKLDVKGLFKYLSLISFQMPATLARWRQTTVHSEKECSKIFLFFGKKYRFLRKKCQLFLIFIKHVLYKTTCFKDKNIQRKTGVFISKEWESTLHFFSEWTIEA